MTLAGAAFAAPYSFAPLEVPGAISTDPFDVGSNGEVVGNYTDSSGHVHGFIEFGGTYTTLDVPGAIGTGATGVNASGAIVGQYSDSNGAAHGFLYALGAFQTTGLPSGASQGWAWGISDSGDIVGEYRSADGVSHGYLQSGAVFTTIDAPVPADAMQALAISAAGVVGDYVLAGDYRAHGFLFDPLTNVLNAIDLPSATSSAAHGINNLGEISGSMHQANVLFVSGYVLSGGVVAILDFPGAFDTVAFGINESGTVVGHYDELSDGGEFDHGFIARRLPEPGTLSLIAMGLLGIGRAAYRPQHRS
jgi:uncharacterized membrane protein